MIKIIKSYLLKKKWENRKLPDGQKLSEKWKTIKKEFPDDIISLIKDLSETETASVCLHNDDITPMEYVVFVLQHCFGFSADESIKKMLEIHTKGDSIILTGMNSNSAAIVVFYLRGHANSRGYPLEWKVKDA